jgi:hypothetical protein
MGFCGDGFCGPGETPVSCPFDCRRPTCGDGICSFGETPGSCPIDCGFCGNGVCNSERGEDCKSCQADCGVCPFCGDGICSDFEDVFSCPIDCSFCGNGLCEPNRGEDCGNCQDDCGICPTCGDGFCAPYENFLSCPIDCPRPVDGGFGGAGGSFGSSVTVVGAGGATTTTVTTSGGGFGGSFFDAGSACLANGQVPPNACRSGKDPVTGSAWVVCEADCQSAWVSADTVASPAFTMPTYHAVSICASLGYTRLGDYGGNCGSICGFCEPFPTSCMQLGRQEFHEDGVVSTGPDGPVLGFTVHWLCLR